MRDINFLSFLFFLLFTYQVLATFPVPRSSIAHTKADGVDYRLPTHVNPVHYEIALEPYFENFTFSGFVKIEVEVLEATNSIILHASELNVTYLALVTPSNQVIDPNSLTNDDERQFLIISFDDTLETGTYFINALYEGLINDGTSGFYRASYEDADGNTRWLGTTQFEPTYARKAFPCFDEPSFKAQFTITIVRASDYNSVSNMPLAKSQDLGNGRVEDSFETTVPMSTYLIAFIVSDYSNITKENQAVYARDEYIADGRGDYALDVGIATIEALENFIGIDYALEKLYQAAIPDAYFYFGAMENWGLVTYRERYLLFKENLTTSSEKQTITTIIAHEYGHQWFGNLVTCEWWSYIWLNEGFATYFEYYAASVVQPTWRLMDQFLLKSVQYALLSDSVESTRPMTFDAGSPSEIQALFDAVAYDKAGSVIRMTEHFLTTPVFKSGLNIYLNNRSYDTAEPSDLWNGFQASIDSYEGLINIPEGETIESILETWNSQAGFPVIHVDRNYATGSINISQSRFLLYNATHDLDQVWTIPINYATADSPDFSDTTPTIWLKDRYQTYATFLNVDSWVIFNKQETGYYRVNYDETNWKLITDYLKGDNFQNVHVLNRAQLVDDAFNLARSGRLSYRILFDLAEYIKQETDYAPLYSLFTGLTYLNRYLIGTDIYEEFKTFIVDHLQTAYQAVGTNLAENDTITDIYNRNNIISWLCLFGDVDCQNNMNEKLSIEEQVHPDMQANVYCGGMRKGNLSNWEFLYQLYTSSTTEEREKSRLITALGCSLDSDILERYLRVILGWESDYIIRSSDVATSLSSIYTGSDVGVNFIFNYFLENFERITESLTTSQISTVLSGVSLRLTKQDHLQQLQTLFESLNETLQTTFESSFNTAINNVNTNLRWYESNIAAISGWFDDYQNSTASTDSSSTSTTEISTVTSESTTASTTSSSSEGSTATTVATSPSTDEDDSSDCASLRTVSWLVSLTCICLFNSL